MGFMRMHSRPRLSMSKLWKEEVLAPKPDRPSSKQAAMHEFPKHWKEMSGQSGRFPVYEHESARKCVSVDATFVCKILQDAFYGEFDVVSCRAARRKSLGKRNFYDLTVSSSEEQEDVVVSQLRDGCVFVLSEVLRQLETNLTRIVGVEQMQNVQSYMMQQAFVDAYLITVPYETVYHGAHALAVDSIVMEGLKSMYSKRLRFGRGTYVSRCFDVARQFATHD